MSSTYAYIYNLGAQTVPVEDAVIFSNNGPLTPDITHVTGTKDITISQAGIYQVIWTVSTVEANQFALFRNGGVIAGAIFGSGSGTQPSTGQAVVSLTANDILTLVNHTSAAAVTLQTLAGGTQTNVNASILIVKLAP